MSKPKSDRRHPDCPLFCGCDNCTAHKAAVHADGDARCGRKWSCWCGACRMAHKDPGIARLKEVHDAFFKLRRTEEHLANMRLLGSIDTKAKP